VVVAVATREVAAEPAPKATTMVAVAAIKVATKATVVASSTKKRAGSTREIPATPDNTVPATTINNKMESVRIVTTRTTLAVVVADITIIRKRKVVSPASQALAMPDQALTLNSNTLQVATKINMRAVNLGSIIKKKTRITSLETPPLLVLLLKRER
jgi:hypothetical protein